MMKIGVRFPALNGGQEQSYTSNDIENFKGEELFDNLAREIIQNSLDAPKPDDPNPVKVVFQMKYLEKAKYPVFAEYEECLDGCRRFWGEDADKKLTRFLNGAESIINKENIPVFVASDYNTKGLCGSKTRRKKDPWQALINEDGVSAKESEASGGSYGIGKNAPFACSGLSLVFYNTYAIDNEKAFEGVARLAPLFDSSGKPTQRIGKFQKYDEEAEVYEPVFEGDDCELRDLFTRTETGTDVIVMGFNQELDWENQVKKAVMKNFFVAIKEGKLVVEVKGENGDYIIDSEKLPELISQYSSDRTMVSAIELYKAFVSPDKQVYLSVDKENDAELYIKADPSYGRNIANFRNTGMLVGQKSRRIFQHYAAVLVIRDEALGELLKDTEPPRHNRWDYKLIEGEDNKERRKHARDVIRKIDDSVLTFLKNQFEVVVGNSIDAEGVGEYLPDDLDELGSGGTGDDILKPKIKLGKLRVAKPVTAVKENEGEKATGSKTDGDVHNEEDNPNDPPKDKVPKPIDPNEDGTDEGTKAGKGTKTVRIPVMRTQRAFPVNVNHGIYKILLSPDETYERLFFSCKAIGEDGRTDVADIEKVMFNGKDITVKKGEAGPLKLESGTLSEIVVVFKSKEKMTLGISMREEAGI